MKKMVLILFTSASLWALTADKTQQIQSIGEKASMKLLMTLGKNLKKHMKQGGVMDAVNFCNSEAGSLTESVDKALGLKISVKRVSLKNRNAGNMPMSDEKDVLEAMERLAQANALPPFIIQKVDQSSYKYYKPLRIAKPICLKCHGNVSASSKLGSFLRSHYPYDKAVGYKMGDLRGAVIVTIKK